MWYNRSNYGCRCNLSIARITLVYMKKPTTSQFVKYFQKFPPSVLGLKFLRAHYSSPGHAATMEQLAHSVGYKSYFNANSIYGNYAAKVARHFADVGVISQDFRDEYVNISLFTKKFIYSKDRDLVLFMSDELAGALEEIGFVKKSLRGQPPLFSKKYGLIL